MSAVANRPLPRPLGAGCGTVLVVTEGSAILDAILGDLNTGIRMFEDITIRVDSRPHGQGGEYSPLYLNILALIVED